jgi:type II secretory pathway component GspD/PulD (secretin)
MKNTITLIALLALIGSARAQQAPPAPQPPEAEPIVVPKGEVMQGIDLEALLEIYSDLVGKTIIQAQNLPKVTFSFRTKNDFTKREAITFYETLLSTRGIAMVPMNSKVVHALPSAEVGKTPPAITVLRADQLPEGDVYIHYVHTLKHILAETMEPLLVTLAKSPNSVTAIEGTRSLVLRDFSNNVRAMLAMVEVVDVEQINDQEIVVVKIKYAIASNIVEVVKSYTGTTSQRATANTRSGTTGRTGSNRFDSILQPAIANTQGSSSRGGLQQRLSQVVQGAALSGSGAAFLGETSITHWERGNEVIIVGSSANVLMAQEIIEKLDRVQPQVLIEAIIMDVALGDDSTFGVSIRQQQQGIVGDGRSKISSALASAMGPAAFAENSVSGANSGFQWWNTFGLKWEVAIEAINNDTRVQVLSTPRIQTTHARKATLFIGETRPVVTGVTTDINGGSNSQYQLKEIGIELEVMPFINNEGVVSMDIKQKVEDTVATQVIDGNPVPITTMRRADATVTVRDGEMVVLGGFIKSKVTATESKMPVLGDFPLLGPLFRRTADMNERTELIMMMRPTVLATPEAAYAKALSEVSNKPGFEAAQFYERLLSNKYRVELEEIRERKKKILLQRTGIDLDKPEANSLPQPTRERNLEELLKRPRR